MIDEQLLPVDMRVTVVDQPQALRLYLEALLTKAGFGAPDSAAIPAVAEVAAPPAVMAPARAAVVPAPAPEVIPPVVAQAQPEATQSPVPHWAQQSFQCLCFKVAGLKLAVPLDKLHGIVPWNEALTPLPGYAPWFLGLLPNRGTKVRVVDIAGVIMPDRGPEPAVSGEARQYSHAVLVDGGKWAIACDSLANVIVLEASEVRWRADRTRRQWLAGTVIEQMCALLDMDRLVEALNAGFSERVQ